MTCRTFKVLTHFWAVTIVLQDLFTTSKWCDVGLRCLYSTLPVALMDTTKLFIVFPLYSICKLALSYAGMFYIKVWICDVIFMTCGLFLILHHVLRVLAIDPWTSTECTETSILTGSGRYRCPRAFPSSSTIISSSFLALYFYCFTCYVLCLERLAFNFSFSLV